MEEAVRLVSSGQKVAAAAKKSDGALCASAARKYACIERNKLRWSVCLQCRILGVSAPGYRQHRARRDKGFSARAGWWLL